MVGLWVIAVDDVHHGLRANVVEQHEALRLVPRQDAWGIQAGVEHQAGDAHKGFAVFFVGRGVHDDARALGRVNAEIAPKAGIGRGRAHGGGQHAVGVGLGV